MGSFAGCALHTHTHTHMCSTLIVYLTIYTAEKRPSTSRYYSHYNYCYCCVYARLLKIKTARARATTRLTRTFINVHLRGVHPIGDFRARICCLMCRCIRNTYIHCIFEMIPIRRSSCLLAAAAIWRRPDSRSRRALHGAK